MIYDNLKDFHQNIQKGKRLLGLDIGTVKIGIAVSDTDHIIATPKEVMEAININKDTGRIRTMLKSEDASGLVIGFPYNMDGTESELCAKIRNLSLKLIKKMDIPIYFQDERLSTAAVSRTLVASGMTRKKRDKIDDKLAASYILQTTLDSIKMQGY